MKVISGGQGMNTKIFDDSGKDITADLWVKSLEYKVTVDEVGKLQLVCLLPKIEISTKKVDFAFEIKDHIRDVYLEALKEAVEKELSKRKGDSNAI